MITFYHNPRCRKSREALQLLEASGKTFRLVDYQKEPLNPQDLETLLVKLGMSASELIRTNELLWKENYKNRALPERELIGLMAEHPRLMERPILESGGRAVVGRPPERILELL